MILKLCLRNQNIQLDEKAYLKRYILLKNTSTKRHVSTMKRYDFLKNIMSKKRHFSAK